MATTMTTHQMTRASRDRGTRPTNAPLRCARGISEKIISRDFRFSFLKRHPYIHPSPPRHVQIPSSQAVSSSRALSAQPESSLEPIEALDSRGIFPTPLSPRRFRAEDLRSTHYPSARRKRQRPDPAQHVAEQPPVEMALCQEQPVV